eukprot:2816463-Amphidinium_carterae.1
MMHGRKVLSFKISVFIMKFACAGTFLKNRRGSVLALLPLSVELVANAGDGRSSRRSLVMRVSAPG